MFWIVDFITIVEVPLLFKEFNKLVVPQLPYFAVFLLFRVISENSGPCPRFLG